MTQSFLQYGIFTWGGLGIIANNKILRAQKSIIKIIQNKPKTYPSAQIFKEFNFSVQKLFQINSLCLVYKMNLINLKPICYNTRHENNIEIPITRSTKASLCFSHIGLNLLNRAPLHIINFKAYKQYKQYVKIWLKNS